MKAYTECCSASKHAIQQNTFSILQLNDSGFSSTVLRRSKCARIEGTKMIFKKKMLRAGKCWGRGRDASRDPQTNHTTETNHVIISYLKMCGV